MSRFILCSALAFVLFGTTIAHAGTARLQVIHNAADPAAAEVDIYVNGDLFLDDFAFRSATPFVDVPSGVELVIGVAPGTSTSASDVIFCSIYEIALRSMLSFRCPKDSNSPVSPPCISKPSGRSRRPANSRASQPINTPSWR